MFLLNATSNPRSYIYFKQFERPISHFSRNMTAATRPKVLIVGAGMGQVNSVYLNE